MRTTFKLFFTAYFLPITPLLSQTDPGTILWTHETGSGIISSPAVGQGGIIFVGTSVGLIAVTNAGNSASNRWTFPLANSPAVGSDGTIYSGGNALYAINPNGTQKWAYGVGSGAGVPAIGVDGTVYFQSAEFLYALTDGGMLKWTSAMTFPGNYSAPAIGLDGTIYVGSSDQPKLFAFNPDGTKKWVVPLASSSVGDSPAIGGDGAIYITSRPLFAFTPEGTNLWSNGEFTDASPVIGKDGTLYIRGFDDHSLYRVSAFGQATPTPASDSIRYTSATCPAIDAAGTVWYWASNTVWALSAAGQVLPWTQVIDDDYLAPQVSPVIGPNGTMYGARGSRLYAIDTGTNGPANSAWPMYRGNARHTGKIEKPALQQPKKRADGNFEFQLFSQTGTRVTIESATNLTGWNTLTSVVPTTVPEPIVDLTASNSPMKFYRAKGGG